MLLINTVIPFSFVFDFWCALYIMINNTNFKRKKWNYCMHQHQHQHQYFICIPEKYTWNVNKAKIFTWLYVESIYLISHLTFNIIYYLGWFKGLLPKSALTVEEEAWNAYPYTKTRYTCPFVEKFSLEIETYYYADDGHQDNVFNLAGSDYRNRIVGK